MRGSLIAIILFITVTRSHGQEFQINGHLKAPAGSMLYLYYANAENKNAWDSAFIKADGSFSIHGKINGPSMSYLSLKGAPDRQNNTLSLFLEPQNIRVELVKNEFRNAKVMGSNTHQQYETLSKKKEQVLKEMEPLSAAYAKAGEIYREAARLKKDERILDSLKEASNAIHEQFTPYNERMDAIDYAFFKEHPASYVTAFMLRFHVADLSVGQLEKYYNGLGSTVQQSVLGKNIGEELRKLKNGSPGSKALNFTTKDINGNELSLADYKGKYVLLDFWASWCVPCRKGNPHLKELYAKYKDKGIEFIGIADDDRAEEAWKKAVDKDGISIWKHVRRGLKYENGEFDHSTDISENFGIHTLPTKILIDPNGMIIGRFGEEEEALNEKLKEVFGF